MARDDSSLDDMVREAAYDHFGIKDFPIEKIGVGRTWTVYKAYRRDPQTPLAIRCRVGTAHHLDILSRQVGDILGDYEYNGYYFTYSKWIDGDTVSSLSVNPYYYVYNFASYLSGFHRDNQKHNFRESFLRYRWYDNYIFFLLSDSIKYCVKNNLFKAVTIPGLPHDLLPSCVIHGDLSNDNIILNNKNEAFVQGFVDFDTVMVGDYMYDLADWATFNDAGHDFQLYENLMYLYHGVQSPHEIPPSFWRRFWHYYLVISLDKLANLHKLGYKDLDRAKSRVEWSFSELQKYY